MNYIIVIPARYKSSRFPGKPLALIAGKPMLQRVVDKCLKVAPLNQVFVATDDQRIEQFCKEKGFNVVMTSEHCLTGTDRVCEVSKKITADVYINVQGDEPIIDPEAIKEVIKAAERHPEFVINAMSQILDEEEFFSKSVPKIVVNSNSEMMYISRSPVPSTKDGAFVRAHKQVCIYAFRKAHLDLFDSVKSKSPCEEIEDIEILRFLEKGMAVKVVEVKAGSIAVDFPADIAKVEAVLNE